MALPHNSNKDNYLNNTLCIHCGASSNNKKEQCLLQSSPTDNLSVGAMSMSVHEKIRLIREAKGLKQEQVAEKVNMSPNGYGDIERGDSDIKLSKLQKLAEIFGIQLHELVDLTENGALNINFGNQVRKSPKGKIYIGSSAAELEKQQLIIELKDKEIAMQQREIAYLKELNELLKGKINHD